MGDRASVFNKGQLGIEVTPGTAVPATLVLQDTGFTPQPRIPVTGFRPHGAKFDTTVQLQKEYSECGIEGDLSFTDLPILLAGLIGPAYTAPGTMTFKPNMFTPDAPGTYTVEHGAVAGQAERFAYGLINALEIRVSDTEARVTGSMFGQVMAEAITPTASLVPQPSNVVDTPQISILVGDTVGGLASIGRGFEFTWGMADKYGRVVTLDATKPSYSSHVERAPRHTARLTVEQDSFGSGLMADLRAKKTKYLRMKITGGIIATTVHYDIQLTMAFKFMQPDRADRQDLYVNNYTLQPIYDVTLGSSVEIIVVNG